jgi:hypothetical protein
MQAYGAYDPVIWDFEFAADRQYVIKNLPGTAAVPVSPRAGG